MKSLLSSQPIKVTISITRAMYQPHMIRMEWRFLLACLLVPLVSQAAHVPGRTLREQEEHQTEHPGFVSVHDKVSFITTS